MSFEEGKENFTDDRIEYEKANSKWLELAGIILKTKNSRVLHNFC